MKFKSTKQFLNYLFEANQDKTDDIVVFLNGKLKGEHLDVDNEIMEKLNSLKGVQLTKALEWFYEKPVTMTYAKDITNKYKGSSSITNFIKDLMRKQNMEVPEELNESYFDLKHWQKMAGIKKILKENNEPKPEKYGVRPDTDNLYNLQDQVFVTVNDPFSYDFITVYDAGWPELIEGSGYNIDTNDDDQIKSDVIKEIRTKLEEINITLDDKKLTIYVSNQNYDKDYERGEYGFERKGGSSKPPPYEKI